jgi:hypothetical protein
VCVCVCVCPIHYSNSKIYFISNRRVNFHAIFPSALISFFDVSNNVSGLNNLDGIHPQLKVLEILSSKWLIVDC